VYGWLEGGLVHRYKGARVGGWVWLLKTKYTFNVVFNIRCFIDGHFLTVLKLKI
jgi:hypothetical protein